MLWKWGVTGGFCLALLAACGGGSEGPADISQHSLSGDASIVASSYGYPQESIDAKRTTERLSNYFGTGEGVLLDSASPQSSSNAVAKREDYSKPSGVQSKAVLTHLHTHRFYNTVTGVHFYTASDAERRNVLETLPHFVYEGTAFRVLAGSANYAAPVYRFYNRVTGTHLYTASESEKDTVIRELGDIFNFEGIAWFGRTSSYPGWLPLYRFFNRRTGTHFYTASEEERAQILSTLPEYVLEGVAYWISSDRVADPQTWQPPAGTTPAAGNYVYYESQAGDFIGQGEQHLWTASDSRIQLNSYGGAIVDLSGVGYSNFRGYIYLPGGFANWRPGYYANAVRMNIAQVSGRPGLDFYMEARGCNEVNGWIYLDSVTHDADGSLAAFEMRFEQHCQWSTGVLRGKVRWSKYDSVMPEGPAASVPANLWRPAPEAIPDNGSFVYFEGEKTLYRYDLDGSRSETPHSYSRLIRAHDSVVGSLGINGNGNILGVLIPETLDNETLLLRIEGMWHLPRLTAGYYANVTKTPLSNPAFGAIDLLYNKYSSPQEQWGCGASVWSEGWFAIDDISYVDNAISTIDLRFEKRCLGSNTRQRGMVRLQAGGN